MNIEGLLAQFERVSDSPDAVPQLRRFIFDLAVRGRLVPQLSDDEPTDSLLSRIEARRKRLVVARSRIERLDVRPVSSQDVPFEVPRTWRWVRFANIAAFSAGRTPSRNEPSFWNNGDYPWVSIADMNDGGVITSTKETVSEKAKRMIFDSEPDPSGTMIMSFKLTIGKIARLGIRAFHNEAIVTIRPYLSDLDDYLFKVLPQFARMGATKGAIKGATLNRDSISNLLVPLPPMGEQRRIVEKIVELMAKCDRLESATMEREIRSGQFALAALATLTAKDPSSSNKAKDFAIGNFDRLTVVTDQISILQQSILNLAVRGRLVRQDPNEEPAAFLVKRIADARLERKRKTQDRRIPIRVPSIDDKLPISLPNGWSVQSFANLFLFIDYRGKTPMKTNAGIPLITAKNIRMGHLNREPREYISGKTFEGWMVRGFPEIGDLFFTTEAPLANVCLNDLDEPFALAQRTICLQPYAEIDTKFFMFVLMSEPFQMLIGGEATGLTAKGIKAAKLKPLPLPIPPLAEQHRIVARVEELLALTTRLQEHVSEEKSLKAKLLNALLNDVIRAA